MSRSITDDENLRLFPQVLATLADTTAFLLRDDCRGEHEPPRVDFLLLLSAIRKDLEILLCAILRLEPEHNKSFREFVEKCCCKAILQGGNDLVELLRGRLRRYTITTEPIAPLWTEIQSLLENYRMHLLPLSGNLKE